MIGRFSDRFLRLVAAIVAVLTVVISLLAWRIASGPMALDWLTPYVADALSSERIRTEIGGTRLRLSDDIALVELVVVDVRVTGSDGDVLAELPEIEISLGLGALLRGVVAVTRLEATAPHLVLLRREDGSIGLRGTADSGASGQIELGALVGRILKPGDADDPAGDLERFTIVGGSLTLIDEASGQEIAARDAELVLLRHIDGLGGSLSFALLQDGEPATIALSGRYDANSDQVHFGLDFTRIVPAHFAGLAPELPLAGIRLALSGRLRGAFALGGERSPVGFELRAEPGEIDRPDLLVAPLPVEALAAEGELAGDLESISVRHLEMTALGATLSGEAALSWHGQQVAGTIEVAARDVTVESLDRFWPPEAGDAARAWVIPHIVAGIVPKASATITIQPGDLAQRPVPEGMVEGRFRFEDLTLRYFEELPPLTGLAGDATFDARRMDFAITSGRVGDIAVSEGSVVITGMGIPGREATQLAARARVDGSIRDVLTLIDHPPLGFAGKAGLTPADASGTSSTNLRVGLPLHRDVSEEEVWVKADAVLRNAGLPTPSFTLEDGDLHLSVDNDGFDLAGDARVDGIPLQLEVRNNFADDAPFSARYRARGLVEAAAITRLAGGALPLDLEGAVDVDATITESPGVRQAEIALDLEPLGIASPLLDWRKAAGERGSLSVSLSAPEGGPISIPAFALAAPELAASGSLRLQAEPLILQSLVLDRLRFGVTEGTLTARRGIDQGYDVSVVADRIDLDPLRDAARRYQSDAAEEGPPAPLRVTLRAGRVRLGGRALREVQADLARDALGWRSALIRARQSEGGTLTVTLAPDGDDRRLRVTSSDAGDLFQTIDGSSRIKGGVLDLDAAIHRQYPGYDIDGTLRITGFTLLEAPILARLLTVASLTGINNLLSGEGIAFDRFEMPFGYAGDTLSVDRVRLSGSQIGLTAKGTLDLARDQIDLSGTIVPVYGINWAIGRIPILGDFLRGTEGEGAFAMTYSVSGATDDPSILVNPLSVLAPGVIRELFSGIFAGAAEPPAVPRGRD